VWYIKLNFVNKKNAKKQIIELVTYKYICNLWIYLVHLYSAKKQRRQVWILLIYTEEKFQIFNIYFKIVNLFQ